jgi:molybdenum cofactor cytidylyltransferase
MGRTKQLLLLGDKPVVRHCLDALLASGIRDIVVVVGLQGEDIAETLSNAPVNIVVNETPNSEMAESIRTGLRGLGHKPTGVLVCLSDHPLVSTKTISALSNEHRQDAGKILVPVYRGRRGHPTLFPATVIQEIFSRMTLRDIIRSDPRRVRSIDVDDEGVVLDMDTGEDYQTMLEKIRGMHSERTRG